MFTKITGICNNIWEKLHEIIELELAEYADIGKARVTAMEMAKLTTIIRMLKADLPIRIRKVEFLIIEEQ